MRTALIAIVLALISMPAIAATYNANTVYSATWNSDEDHYDYYGSFAGKDKNRDGFLTKDELSSFSGAFFVSSPYIYVGRVIGGTASLGNGLTAFRYQLFEPNAWYGTMDILAEVITCVGCGDFAIETGLESTDITNDAKLIWTAVTPVPVPASGLLLAPLAGLLAVRRKRKV